MLAKMTLSSRLLFAVIFIASGVLSDPSRRLNPTRPKAFDYAADAERVVGELHHNFSCDGREYGYYADQGQQCQVFHICMPVKTATGRILDTFQFSFFCPNQTRFSQDSRTCINEAQAYPCHKAHTLYDLNKAIGHKPNKKKRPVNLKDGNQSNFKANNLVTPSSARRTNTPSVLKESFDDSSVTLGHFDESSVGFSVQEGVTPVHTDSNVAIGAPAVDIPQSAGNVGTTTTFAGRPHSPSTAAPPVNEFVSNNLSEHLEAPEFVVPPGSQIISTKSLQQQNTLSRPTNINQIGNPSNVNAKASTINVSTHGSTGLSNSGISSHAPTLTSSSFLTTSSLSSTTPLVPSIESTTPQTSFTREDAAFSRVTSANQANLGNNALNSVSVTNRGNGFTSTESTPSFRPIPQRSSVSFNAAGNANGGNAVTSAPLQNTNRFSNSHTLEAAPLSSTGTSTSSSSRGSVSTFASRARAHITQTASQNQASQSNGQRSQAFAFSQNVGNQIGITSQPIITTHSFATSTPQPFTTTQDAIPSLSLQFTPPPINHANVGVARPLQIPGFSAGTINNDARVQKVQNEIFTNQEGSTLGSFPTTTEYYAEGDEFLTTIVTDAPFESTKAVVENSNTPTPSHQHSGNIHNRGSTQQITVQRRPIQRPSINQGSAITTNVQSKTTVNAGSINSINSFSNNNRATILSHQNSHERTTSLLSGTSNNQGLETPTFSQSLPSQISPVPSRSTQVTQGNNLVSLEVEQVRISSQNREEETHRESHNGNTQQNSLPSSSFRGSTTPNLSSTRTRNNLLTSSRGLRTQTATTGTENNLPQVVTTHLSNTDIVNRRTSHSGGATSENDVTSNRGSVRGTPQPIVRNTTRRPVTRNRGSKKFQPSQFLLQSAGFINSQWQPSQNHNAPARSSISRSRSRSQSDNARSSNQISSTNQRHDENDSQSTVVNTSFDNARIISTSTISPEISEQTNNLVSKDKSQEGLPITATTLRPVTRTFTQSTSRGRAFGSQVSSNNLLSSQQSRSTQSSYGASVSTTESSLPSQYGNSQTVPISQTGTSFTTTPASRQIISTSAISSTTARKQSITSTPNLLRQTIAPDNFSRTTSRVATSTLNENAQNSAARKVIKKKIIVNGRPGSRKTPEPTVAVTTIKPVHETPNEEEEKKRQRALDALARFSPGFGSANLLAFRLIPNGAKKKTTTTVSTTEATVQQTSKPQNSVSNKRRGNTRARFTTTPSPIVTTVKTSQARSRISTRRLSRPVTQKSLSTTSTTTEPTATTISPFSRLRSNSRRVINKQDKDVSESTESSQATGSISTSSQSRSHNRGNTKFTQSLNNRRKIVKKITPLSDDSDSSKNIDSAIPSSSSSSDHTTSPSIAKQAHQPLTQTGQLRVVGTSIESSVSSNLQNEKSRGHASSSHSSSASSSLSKSRFNSRSRSSLSSKNRGNLIAKQGAVHEPLTDLELEALSAIAQVNTAFSNAAKTQQQDIRSTSSATSSRRRNSSRSRSRSL